MEEGVQRWGGKATKERVVLSMLTPQLSMAVTSQRLSCSSSAGCSPHPSNPLAANTLRITAPPTSIHPPPNPTHPPPNPRSLPTCR